ncbi:unnamed protein product, partial [Ixodes pacificus]
VPAQLLLHAPEVHRLGDVVQVVRHLKCTCLLEVDRLSEDGVPVPVPELGEQPAHEHAPGRQSQLRGQLLEAQLLPLELLPLADQLHQQAGPLQVLAQPLPELELLPQDAALRIQKNYLHATDRVPSSRVGHLETPEQGHAIARLPLECPVAQEALQEGLL